MKSGINDLETAVAQRPCNDFGAPIMAIKTWFGDKDT